MSSINSFNNFTLPASFLSKKIYDNDFEQNNQVPSSRSIKSLVSPNSFFSPSIKQEKELSESMEFEFTSEPYSEKDSLEYIASEPSSESYGPSRAASVLFCERELLNFERLKLEYAPLFANPGIKETGRTFPPMMDIEMDAFQMIPVGERKWLGTTGVCNCISVCARASSQHGSYLALAHLCLTEPEEMLKTFMDAFREVDCEESTVEIYLVGGILPVPGGLREKETEAKFIKLSEKYPIKGIMFNKANEHCSIDVVLSSKAVYYRKSKEKPFFEGHDPESSMNISSDVSDRSEFSMHPESSDVSFYEGTNQSKIEITYASILSNEHIQIAQRPFEGSQLSDNLDEVFSIQASRNKPLSIFANALTSEIAICACAITATRRVLAMVQLWEGNAEALLASLMHKFREAGCFDSSIHIFLVGGNEQSEETQKRLLLLSKKFPIIGAKFNLVEKDEYLDVMINHEGIYYKIS